MGVFQLRFSSAGWQSLSFPGNAPAPLRKENWPTDRALDGLPEAWLERARAAVQHRVGGQALGALPPLDLVGTPFQLKVWKALTGIPPGETRTYGQVAESMGQPGAARAVGRACGANPLPLIVPCHRVLAAHSGLGGFSGGRAWKPFLLAREGWGGGCGLPLFQHGNEPDGA